MAESAVIVAVGKLISFVNAGAHSLGGIRVRSDINAIRRELESMRAFLKDAEEKAEEDSDGTGVKTWVKQVRDAAYEIEDVIDEYTKLLKPQKQHQNRGLIWLQRVARSVIHVRALRRLSSSLKDIRQEVIDINRRKESYNLKSVRAEQLASSSSSAARRHTWQDPRSSFLYTEESEHVGIEARKKHLIGCLNLEENNSRRLLVAVTGMGGLGKTTLVRKAYDDPTLRQKFEFLAWITVPQSHNKVDVLKALVKSCDRTIPKTVDGGEASFIHSLVDSVRSRLSKKRYLIVFDDVWDKELWPLVKSALPSVDAGSAILMTTRSKHVALAWKESYYDYICELQPLSPQEAWSLFCKKAFQNDSDGHCPPYLEELSRNMVRKCEGLPLAIVAIGSLLSTKEKLISEWQKLHNSLSFELGNNLTIISRILLLNYRDLPYYLKPCFLYFGIFPGYQSIARGRLIRLWIAEGFIEENRGSLTPEEIAEDYLAELVDRRLIQVAWEDDTGRARAFRVHDLMLELILRKSKELSFCQEFEQNLDVDGKIRRLSIRDTAVDDKSRNMDDKLSIRSLFLFGVEEISRAFLSGKLLEAIHLLKVLDLQDAPLDGIPKEVGNLYHLRYLSLRNTNVRTLPKSIGKLRNLQTLDLRRTERALELPMEIGLHKLRHLLVSSSSLYSTRPSKIGLRESCYPKGLGFLKELLTLSFVWLNSDTILDLRNLNHLRKLGVAVNNADCDKFFNTVQHLDHLHTLRVGCLRVGRTLYLDNISSPPPMLKRLHLSSCINIPSAWICGLHHIVSVKLTHSELMEDPASVLGGLPNLMELGLDNSYKGERLHFQTSGFRKLKVLRLVFLRNMNSVLIEEGALPLLEKLFVRSCPSLKEVPSGIQYLKNLTTLGFDEMPRALCASPQYQEIVGRVPNVYFHGIGSEASSSQA
ncbi:hypothetical protein Ancab_024924 [Ancistrocladus abbreviatus]